MEKWTEVLHGIVPEGAYATELVNGEEKGLIVKLENEKTKLNIEFGLVSAVRMLDEGIILQGLFDDHELNKYKAENFKNIIYKVEDGEFEKSVKKMSGEIYDVLEMSQYLIITSNYVIEVISQTEPKIEILQYDDLKF